MSGDVAYVDLPPEEARAFAASELRGGLLWVAFGIAVLALSWRMDRLEAQHINPYTVPGLLPGLLGIVMILLGGLLALRSWRRGGRFVGGPRFAMASESARRLGPEEQRLVEELARRAALAVDNARLYAEAKRVQARHEVALEAGRMGAWEWNIPAGRITWSPTLERLHRIPEGSFRGELEKFGRIAEAESEDVSSPT